jgi:hypothetical protein
MEKRKEIVNGKKRMVIISSASGVNKVKDAVKYIMDPGYEYIDEAKDNTTK